MKSSRCVLIPYIYFIIQFRQHNIKVKVTATCFDLTSHLQAYLRTKTNYNIRLEKKLLFVNCGLWNSSSV